MDKGFGRLTVYFDEPFWVGVFERIDGGKLSVCKITFGAEPKDCEVWDFVLKNYSKLKFSPAVDAEVKEKVTNPKRLQRKVRKQTSLCGIGTRSQQALQLLREKNKLEKKSAGKQKREAEKQRTFVMKQQKRRKKHKGH